MLPRKIRFAQSADFGRPYSPHLISMSFPPGTRMLRFPGCPFLNGTIRRSWDQPLPAGPPCFSQLVASFFGSQTKPFTIRLLESSIRPFSPGRPEGLRSGFLRTPSIGHRDGANKKSLILSAPFLLSFNQIFFDLTCHRIKKNLFPFLLLRGKTSD